MDDHQLPSSDEIAKRVLATYSQVAQRQTGHVCCAPQEIYAPEDLSDLPDTVIDMSCGCGNPVALAALMSGETVLDVGSGGGIDLFLAARHVGTTGKVVGLDILEDMLTRVQKHATMMQVGNVELHHGSAEQMPFPDNTFDVAISNCVIAMLPNKAQVYAEIFRVLKPGGRLVVSDIIGNGDQQAANVYSSQDFADCVAGIDQAEYIATVVSAGFERVEVLDITLVHFRDARRPVSVKLRAFKASTGN